jgi:hypothetical protein
MAELIDIVHIEAAYPSQLQSSLAPPSPLAHTYKEPIEKIIRRPIETCNNIPYQDRGDPKSKKQNSYIYTDVLLRIFIYFINAFDNSFHSCMSWSIDCFTIVNWSLNIKNKINYLTE